MPQKDPSRTEKATSKRRDKARNDGQVGKSQEFAKAIMLMVGLYFMRMYIGVLDTHMREIFAMFLGSKIMTEATRENMLGFFYFCLNKLFIMLAPIFAVLVAAAYLVMRLQVGKLWVTKNFTKFNLGKMFNLMAGLKKLMLDPKALVRLGRSLLQAAVIGVVPYVVIKQELPHILPLYFQTPEYLAVHILEVGYKMVNYAIFPMLLIGIADLWYEKWDYEEQLKMTKEEVKDERKQAYGDEKVKMQQRQKMMEFMAKRMLQDVPKADVVVTNPTHIAVALMYNAVEAPAPLVLAKGADHLAEKIKEVAREHNVPIQENKPLAQALYKQVEIGDVIPEELYQAVAAILAKLNKFKGRTR